MKYMHLVHQQRNKDVLHIYIYIKYTHTHTHTHIHTTEYYSAIKKNKIMSFAVIWMDPKMVILSGIRQRKTNVILLICGI